MFHLSSIISHHYIQKNLHLNAIKHIQRGISKVTMYTYFIKQRGLKFEVDVHDFLFSVV